MAVFARIATDVLVVSRSRFGREVAGNRPKAKREERQQRSDSDGTAVEFLFHDNVTMQCFGREREEAYAALPAVVTGNSDSIGEWDGALRFRRKNQQPRAQ